MHKNHKYIIFGEKPRTGTVTEVSSMLTNILFPNKQSINKWRKDKTKYTLSWENVNGVKQISAPINYLIISEYIRQHGHFNAGLFNIRKIECFWLDFSLEIKINWHSFDETSPKGLFIEDGIGQQQYGKNYPIIPRLNREGHAFTTMQPQLIRRIINLRNKLVENSHLALEDEWFFDLRSLISETVSIIEITLNQIYNKAEYDPLPHWTFDKEKLGNKHGRRFEDKLKWVHNISGNHLNAENYINSINNLRELRNHMMHFDPPSLVIPIEEACVWMNQVIDVGHLLIKIRQAIGAEVSMQLMNFILQKEVIFNPEAAFSKRLPFTGDGDYATSTWKK